MLVEDEQENLEEIEVLLYAQVYHESMAETQLEEAKNALTTSSIDINNISGPPAIQKRSFRYFDEENKLTFYEDRNPSLQTSQETLLDNNPKEILNSSSNKGENFGPNQSITEISSVEVLPEFIINLIQNYRGIPPDIAQHFFDKNNWSFSLRQQLHLFETGFNPKHWVKRNLRFEIRKVLKKKRRAEKIKLRSMEREARQFGKAKQVIFLSSDSENDENSSNLNQSIMTKTTQEATPSDEDEIIYIAPPPVPVVSVDTDSDTSDNENKMKTKEAEIENNKSQTSTEESARKKKLKSNVDLTKKPVSSIEESSSIQTEEDFFLNETAHSTNQFNFSLHGSDFNNANDDFVRPLNPGECYETESSTSTSDFNRDSSRNYSNSVKTIVFNEVEFPKEDIFTNNLEGFEELITSKETPKKKKKVDKNKINKETPSKSSEKVRQAEVLGTDSSSEESDYEATFVNLPSLSPMVKMSSPKKGQKNASKLAKKKNKRLSEDPVDLLEESMSRKKKKEDIAIVATEENIQDTPKKAKKKKKKSGSKSNEENEGKIDSGMEIEDKELENVAIDETPRIKKKKNNKKKKKQIPLPHVSIEKEKSVQDNNGGDTKTDHRDNKNENEPANTDVLNKDSDDEVILIDNTPAPIEIPDSDLEDVSSVDLPDLLLANTSIAGNTDLNRQQEVEKPQRDFSEFDVHNLQAKMSDNPNLWKISVHDRIQNKSTKRGPRCTKCRQFGHMAVKCPNKPSQPNCQLCGDEGHAEPRCPNKICFTCGNKGSFSTVYCYNCRNTRSQECNICKCVGHNAKYCPDLWRRYHLTTKPGPIVKPSNGPQLRPEEERWCAGCASSGHLDYECNSYKYIREYPAVIPWIKDYSCVYNEDQQATDRNDIDNTTTTENDIRDITKSNNNVSVTEEVSQKNSPDKPPSDTNKPTNLKVDYSTSRESKDFVSETFKFRGSDNAYKPNNNNIIQPQQMPHPVLNIFTPAANNIVANQINNYLNPSQNPFYQNNTFFPNPVSYIPNQSTSYTSNESLFTNRPRETYNHIPPANNFYQEHQYFVPWNIYQGFEPSSNPDNFSHQRFQSPNFNHQRFEPHSRNDFNQQRFQPATVTSDLSQQKCQSPTKTRDLDYERFKDSLKKFNLNQNNDRLKFDNSTEKLVVKFRDTSLQDLHEFVKEELKKLSNLPNIPKIYKKKCDLIKSLNKKNNQRSNFKQLEVVYKSLNMFLFGVRKLREGKRNYDFLQDFVHLPGNFLRGGKRKQLYDAYKYIFGGRHRDVNYRKLVNISLVGGCKFE